MTDKLIAEFVGTFLLVFLAVGAAVSGIQSMGMLGVALAFGLVLAALAYSLGPTSGCHVNPAVTLAFWLSKRQDGKEAALYVVMQFLGAALGGFVLWVLVNSGGVTDQTGALGSNAFGGDGPNALGAFLTEALLTAAFVGVILLVTDRASRSRLRGDRHRRCAGRRSPGGHPTDRHLGQPGPFVGPGPVRRRGIPSAGLAVPHRTPGGWRAGGVVLADHTSQQRSDE